MNNDVGRVPLAPGSREPSPDGLGPTGFDPSRLSCHEQMLDAQEGCVPCKLCGGRAVISDAGPGAGYYIQCKNSQSFRPFKGCLIDERRLGGWAYNVRDWWNRLHSVEPVASDRDGSGEAGETHSGSTEGDSPGRRHRQ